MSTCRFCGAENEEWMKICQECGNPVIDNSKRLNKTRERPAPCRTVMISCFAAGIFRSAIMADIRKIWIVQQFSMQLYRQRRLNRKISQRTDRSRNNQRLAAFHYPVPDLFIFYSFQSYSKKRIRAQCVIRHRQSCRIMTMIQ